MENKSVVLFIDAENISFKYAKDIFNIASSYGELIIKRIYADWTSKEVGGWKNQIAEHSIIAMQNFKLNNKNSSDMYLMAEALSIFYEKDVEIFIIVSSDSDYIPLVQKLRENKKQVIGIGENKTNKFYINAFNEFCYLNKKQEKSEDLIEDELFSVINQLIEEKNRAEYAKISSIMKRKYPNFNPRNYGCPSFRKLIDKFIKDEYQEKVADDNTTFYLVKK